MDPVDGALRARQTAFFFPLRYWVRALFARSDIVPHLYNNDIGRRAATHVTRSRGFKAKITDNRAMNGDRRNLGLIGTTDGVPYFADQRRSCWPFVLRAANLPDSLSMSFQNAHLHMLAPSEFWELDEAAGVLRRRIRAPKSLQPLISVITDDLLAAYNKGFRTIDASIPVGRAHRRFDCR